jgi:hypothetical protein
MKMLLTIRTLIFITKWNAGHFTDLLKQSFPSSDPNTRKRKENSFKIDDL